MTEPSRYPLEPLWEDVEFVLSRAVQDGETSRLLVVAPASAQPAPGSFTRQEHAYALRDELDPAWSARPLRLVRHRERSTLLLEDPGGEPLARLLGQPRQLQRLAGDAAELLSVERLEPVVEGALLHRFDGAVGVVGRCDEDDGDAGVGSHPGLASRAGIPYANWLETVSKRGAGRPTCLGIGTFGNLPHACKPD
jgi:hypothetical protein